MGKDVTIKNVLFWAAVALIPGGSFLLVYRLGRDHRKLKLMLNKQLEKLRR